MNWWLLPIGLGAMGVMWAGFTLLWKWLNSGLLRPPNYLLAVQIVCEAIGMPLDKRPRIFWIADGKRCGHLDRGYISTYDGRCVAGQSGFGYSNVSWWKGAKFSETALAHELAHHMRWMRNSAAYNDPETVSHADPKFIADVNAGTAALIAAEQAGRL